MVACGDKKKDKASKEDDDEDDRPKKKKKKDGDAKSSADKPAATASATGDATGATSATGDATSTGGTTAVAAGKPDLDKLLGPKGEWTPVVFSKLKEDMPPADVAKVFPGADKSDTFGIVGVDVKDQPGVWRWQFLYLGETKNKLAFAEIQFDPKLTTDDFWNSLMTAMKKKYGDKFQQVSTRSITWTNDDFKTAELTEETSYEIDPPKSFFSISVML